MFLASIDIFVTSGTLAFGLGCSDWKTSSILAIATESNNLLMFTTMSSPASAASYAAEKPQYAERAVTSSCPLHMCNSCAAVLGARLPSDWDILATLAGVYDHMVMTVHETDCIRPCRPWP